MVRALHRAGIEVILDVVFNHTAEGDHTGPTLNLRGFENSVYYLLKNDRAHYENYSGTGNTLNANHPIVRRMIVDSLHYWVEQMHVDGFRFDLASILSRDETGRLMPSPPVLWDIDSDPVLAGTKLIAEAWDAAGLYQVGSFPGHSWREWNGRFRDDLRSFVRGDPGTVGRLADRLIGSPQIYARPRGRTERQLRHLPRWLYHQRPLVPWQLCSAGAANPTRNRLRNGQTEPEGGAGLSLFHFGPPIGLCRPDPPQSGLLDSALGEVGRRAKYFPLGPRQQGSTRR